MYVYDILAISSYDARAILEEVQGVVDSTCPAARRAMNPVLNEYLRNKQLLTEEERTKSMKPCR